MRFAIIDIGTNTFKLLIIDENENVIFKNKLPVKLGENGLSQNIIAEPAYQRGINALITHKKTIDEHQCNRIFTFATSGLRSTNNGAQFIADVKKETGIEINVIDGNQEAKYIYSGVKKDIQIPSNSCIIDIGGGSTEFIICNQDNILWKKSYRLGVSRLYELFQPNDPLNSDSIKLVENYLNKELQDLFSELTSHKVTHLIGTSGSFKSIAKIIGIKNNAHPDKYYSKISRTDFDHLHNQFLNLDVSQRLKINGMEPMRADMIPMASVLINKLLNQHQFESILVSKYSLKEGVIEDVLSSL